MNVSRVLLPFASFLVVLGVGASAEAQLVAYDGFDYPVTDILSGLADSRALRYDPTPLGLPEARAAVAEYYADRGIPVDASRILLTASTSEAYSYLFKLLADPGDEVLTPRPSYPLFEYLAALESVVVPPRRRANAVTADDPATRTSAAAMSHGAVSMSRCARRRAGLGEI